MKILYLVVFFLLSLSANAEIQNLWSTVQPSYRQVTITGFSRARHEMVLATEVAGKVGQVYADVGDQIPKHRKISCLDETFVKIDIKSVASEIEQQLIEIRYLNKQVKRYQNLLSNNSVAISQLDDFVRQLGHAKQQAEIKKLEKKRLQEKKARHCIKSSEGWRVMERYVEPGQWLAVGAPVAKVGKYSELLVPLALSFNELSALKENQNELKVWLSDYQLMVPATIKNISPAFDEISRKVKIDLLIKEGLPVYRGGLRIEIKLNLAEPDGTFQIAKEAVDMRFEEYWVEDKKGQSFRVEMLGHAENDFLRVFSKNIKPGDQFKIFYP